MKVYKIKVDGKVYEVEVEVLEKEGSITEPVKEEKEKTGEGQLIKSPMQGTVLSINVKKGDRVSKGDVLMVIEVMKMENEITSNISGVVDEVFAVRGKSVDSGEVLLVIK